MRRELFLREKQDFRQEEKEKQASKEAKQRGIVAVIFKPTSCVSEEAAEEVTSILNSNGIFDFTDAATSSMLLAAVPQSDQNQIARLLRPAIAAVFREAFTAPLPPSQPPAPSAPLSPPALLQ
jgi:hypothetical protein